MKNIIIETLANKGIKAEYTKVNKNGIEKDAIRIITGENISPQFYFDEDTDIDEFVEMVYNHMMSGQMPKINVDELATVDFFKKNARVCVRPITERIDDVKKETKYEGIEMYIRINVMKDGTFVLQKTMLEKYGISEDEAFEIAMGNTLSEIKIEDMAEVMAEMLGISIEELEEQMGNIPRQIIVTNNDKVNGASAILFDNVIEHVKDRLGCEKLLLLPSSIHECILGNADDGVSLEEATKMVRDVNATQVALEERLSDIAYLV